MSGFQKQVNTYQAPAVDGDFASSNPRVVFLAGEGALIAGAAGVNAAKFAWVSGIKAYSYGTYPAAPQGFVANSLQASNAFLAESGTLIAAGMPVTVYEKADFWVKNSGASTSVIGDTIYATYTNGAATAATAATGAVVTGSVGGSVTAAIGSTSTGTGSGTDLTLSSLTGYVSIGDKVSGTGVPAGTTIVSQTSGTTGLAGVYVTSAATTSSAATITTFGTKLKVTAVGSGTVQIGDAISGTGVPSGAIISTFDSGTAGGVGIYGIDRTASAYAAGTTVTIVSTTLVVTAITSGTIAVGMPVTGSNITANTIITGTVTTLAGTAGYVLSLGSTAASTTVTGVGGVATTFKARTVAAVGELMKISNWS